MRKAKRLMLIIFVLCIMISGCGRILHEKFQTESMNESGVSSDENESIEEHIEQTTKVQEKYTNIVPEVRCFRVLEIESENVQWRQAKLIADKEAFNLYWTEVTDQFYGGKDASDASEFNEHATKYSEAWFVENQLIVLVLKHSSWDYCHEVQMVKDNESDQLRIEIKAQRPKHEIYPHEAYWIMLLEVGRENLGKVNEVDVTLDESVDPTKSVVSATVRTLDKAANQKYFSPIIVRNRQELKETCRCLFMESDDGNETEWFPTELSEYQEQWFEKNTLILIPVIDGSIGYHYDARLIRDTSDQSLSVDIIRWIREDTVRFQALHSQLIVIEVDHDELEQISEMTRNVVKVVLPAEN